MSKVGIITIHKSPNYGGTLQAYALYKFICDFGHECEIIDLYRPVIPGYVYSPKYPSLVESKYKSEQGMKHFLGTCVDRFKSDRYKRRYSEELALKQRRYDSFNLQVNYSNAYSSIEELYNQPPLYDIYVTGSDQVWNPTIGYNIEPYFLTFAPKYGKRISYGASIGLPCIPSNLCESYKSWISQYDAVAVREEEAKSIIAEFLPHKDVEVVCDPTFLISSEEWIRMSETPDYNDYILCFTLHCNPELYKYSKKIADEKGKRLVIFSHGYADEQYNFANRVYDAGPKEWIGWINKADIVITDSFHATIFSMHCRKPFLTYIAPTNQRGSRIENLLLKAGLNNHIVRDLSRSYSMDIENYDLVWSNLNDFIDDSKQYLIRALSL